MAKIKLLVDTDVIIDYLKGVKPVKSLFKSENIENTLSRHSREIGNLGKILDSGSSPE